MMYPSDGSQSKKDPNVFLGKFAEGIIEDIQRKRMLDPGDYAFKGLEGMEIKDRAENYA